MLEPVSSGGQLSIELLYMLPYASAVHKRVEMPSKHTIDEQRLIDGLPMGLITAFRSSIYSPSYFTANPHLFITKEWIDAVQLRDFLDRAKSLGPISASHPVSSPPTRVKVEYNVPDVPATIFSAAARATAAASTPVELREKPKAAKANDGHTIFVSANSSGRVKTRTIG
ncbi:hypothetical protein DFH09DRAFT_1361449 [Mycena vulgaris]|nr:hypothetical protein DFH09DRAFT_1361449 [Mycena vulgaris]